MRLTKTQRDVLRTMRGVVENLKKQDPGYTGGYPARQAEFFNSRTLTSLREQGKIEVVNGEAYHKIHGTITSWFNLTP
jgi:hypothetical protein